MAITREDFEVDDDGTKVSLEVETFDPVPFEPSASLSAAIAAGHVRLFDRTNWTVESRGVQTYSCVR